MNNFYYVYAHFKPRFKGHAKLKNIIIMFKLKCTYSNFKCMSFNVAGTFYGYLDKKFTKPVFKSDIYT